jgi:hypothetical protein
MISVGILKEIRCTDSSQRKFRDLGIQEFRDWELILQFLNSLILHFFCILCVSAVEKGFCFSAVRGTNSSIPQFLNSSILQFLNSSVSSVSSVSLRWKRVSCFLAVRGTNSSILQFFNSSIPQFLNSSILLCPLCPLRLCGRKGFLLLSGEGN